VKKFINQEENFLQLIDNQSLLKTGVFFVIYSASIPKDAPLMKRLVDFFKREWFLFAMVAAIGFIFFLFELL
jgi:hypothetical protein